MNLTPSLQKSLWLGRFASRVGELLPGVAPAEAWRYAESTFENAADLTPEEAAEVFAQELPPLDVGAPE